MTPRGPLVRWACAVLLAFLFACGAAPAPDLSETDWPAYGRDLHGTRHLPGSASPARTSLAWSPPGPFEPAAYSVTSPPLAANGLVVVGSSIADDTRSDPASGEVRAFDGRTGALRWSWDPIPQDPADPAYGDWGGEMAHRTGGANTGSVLSADPERDLVFVPTSSPAPGRSGARRTWAGRS